MLKYFSSKHPTNEFAPTWHIPMYNELFNFQECGVIHDWLLDNQEEFLKYPVNPVGDTGLADSSITARLGSYNLFHYNDQCESLQTLYNYIQAAYLDFITKTGSAVRECNIVGWFNVLEKGDKIKPHHHGAGSDSYLSGNLHVKDYESYTLYVSPYDTQTVLPIKNKLGDFTMFPSYLEHCTTEHTEDIPRVSIAFDIVLNYSESDQSIPFINEDILKNITEENEYAR